ncbi:DUF2793 domain-containing protein [Qipengyuania sp.]|uniref:DUF2793 domain-containing protein n=1 Tax=Qipengyuania sp. TaxID=2004515 RepID=UPI00373701CC
MADSVALTDRTARFALPYLFAGQAQREFYLNESLARIDALLHAVVQSEQAQPPGSPTTGQAFLIAASATGVWAGRGGQIAAWDGQQWTFIEPRAGMRVYENVSRTVLRYGTAWERPMAVANPQSGPIVDAEARAAIGQIIDALRKQGLLA